MPMMRAPESASRTICRYLGSKMWRGRTSLGNSTVSGSGKMGMISGILRLVTGVTSSPDLKNPLGYYFLRYEDYPISPNCATSPDAPRPRRVTQNTAPNVRPELVRGQPQFLS